MMDFSTLTELVQPELLGQLQVSATHEPMSVTFYRCPHGHQAVDVHKGTDTFPALAHRGASGECLRCMGERGERVVMA